MKIDAKNKLIIIILCILTVIAIIIGVIFLCKNIALTNSNIEIIDATYTCNKVKEKIAEDNVYVYYLPCQKINSVFVKFKNNNSKVLIRDALSNKEVTIDELIKAGLEVIKEKK